MADYGHKETDKRLVVMEKRIAKVYADTLAEAKDKLSAVLAEFRELDEKKAKAVADGKLSKKAYTGWRQELLGKEKHLRDMIDVLTEDFTNADKIAMKIVNGEAKDVYALNANYAAYDIEKKANVNLSWTLYDHSTVERLIREEPDLLPLPSVDVPVDKRWNQKHITAAINRGILLGDPIQDIAKRLVTVASMNLNAAVRSARTATTAAECAGRIRTYKYAESLGIQLKQMWRATLDDRTRHAHRMLDGQMVDIGEKFKVDGYELEYPGDPSAPGYLVYNCRCTVVSVDKTHDPNAPRASKLSGMRYEDWRAGKDLELQKAQKFELKQRENELKNEENRAILKEKIRSGEFPLKVNKGQQRKHIEGTNEYKTYLRQRIANGKDPQGVLTISEKETTLLLEKYATKGHHISVTTGKDGNVKIREYIQTDQIIGKCSINSVYANTHRVVFHYSKRGIHIVPIPEEYNG
nr:MAG TPA: minor capsid protein [Caudoviricetes sp.]